MAEVYTRYPVVHDRMDELARMYLDLKTPQIGTIVERFKKFMRKESGSHFSWFDPASFRARNAKICRFQYKMFKDMGGVAIRNFNLLDSSNFPIGRPLLLRLNQIPEVKVVKERAFVCFEDGGLPEYYSRILPALLLNQLLCSVMRFPNSRVELHVFCMGSIADPDHPFMSYGGSDEYVPDSSVVGAVLDALFSGDSFKGVLERVNGNFKEGDKPIRRVCVWFHVKRHVITCCWEKTKDGSVCFVVDNLGDVSELSKMIVNEFNSRINDFDAGGVYPLIADEMKILTHTEKIETDEDMSCVSYMARITFYLAMVDFPTLNIVEGSENPLILNTVDIAGNLSRIAGFDFEQDVFHRFLDDLINFCERANTENKLICISPTLSFFENIKDIRLLTFLPEEMNDPASIERYAYYGTDGFQTGDRPCNGCAIVAQFQLLSECVQILNSMRLSSRRL